MGDKTLNERVYELEQRVKALSTRIEDFIRLFPVREEVKTGGDAPFIPLNLRPRKKPQRAYPEDLVDAPN